MHRLTSALLIVFLMVTIPSGAADSTPICGKNRTTAHNVNVGLKTKEMKGTVAIFISHRKSAGNTKLVSFFIPDVTYQDAMEIGNNVVGFYWVPTSVASFQEVKNAKKSGLSRVSTYDNGCSCPCGGTCYDQENGGCFCDCDACVSKQPGS